jgi:type I restriction-modification system DNA methylase subunit
MPQKNSAIDHSQEIIKLITTISRSHDTHQVFNDWLEISAISVSNRLDFRQERENRYLELINSYEKNYQSLLSQMFAHLVEALEEKAQAHQPEDILGRIFHKLELHNRYKGQFFTPQHVSDVMATITCTPESLKKNIAHKGYVRVSDPACGSGVMLTSMCKAMTKEGFNYCTQLLATGTDIDLKCVHMAYLQMSLYGVPAVIVHGDSLTVEEWSAWYTPIYLANGWEWRRHCNTTNTDGKMPASVVEPSEIMTPVIEKDEQMSLFELQDGA